MCKTCVLVVVVVDVVAVSLSLSSLCPSLCLSVSLSLCLSLSLSLLHLSFFLSFSLLSFPSTSRPRTILAPSLSPSSSFSRTSWKASNNAPACACDRESKSMRACGHIQRGECVKAHARIHTTTGENEILCIHANFVNTMMHCVCKHAQVCQAMVAHLPSSCVGILCAYTPLSTNSLR